MDIRDLAYDLTHWKWDKEHIAQTVLDAVGLIPGIGVVKNLDEAGTVLKALFNGAETLTPALAVAAKISPEAAEWLMKGIAKYGDTVTDLLHGAAKNADDAAEWGLLVSAVRKAEDSGGILKSAARNAVETLDAAQSSAKSADELLESAGNVGKIITKIEYKPSSGVILKANPDKTTTILGSFDKDMKNIVNEMGNVKSTYFGAKKGGFNVLNVPDDMYKSADQFWNDVNKPWLDEVINRGDDIVLATKPTGRAISYIDINTGKEKITGFGREYKYLLDNGYDYDVLTNMMIKK
ncbi:hypothetical protein [Papillibacter cinnamivorans]|uniref:Uncharacterized protein n=1 Tax=Papillibacter cinnamivorans DSM 12816 TaxID=1122930 RepID=A0A1W2CV31_9FIRM|nr:hypothetical protein [Papillibacter cinnamivorans]SMC88774.1 hypothetical protein SAMN02745168_0220 [Papillibacter cinnamivorans DSM 12816]